NQPPATSTGAATRKGLRLALERVARLGDRQRPARRSAALLGDMRHLMRDQLVAVSGPGPVFAGAEEDVVADGEGARLDRAGELLRLLADMDAHVVERATPGALQSSRERAIERPAAAVGERDRLLDVRVHEPARR